MIPLYNSIIRFKPLFLTQMRLVMSATPEPSDMAEGEQKDVWLQQQVILSHLHQ